MDYKMNRGDIYWVDLNPTMGSEINKLRPCVVVGATPINQARHTIVVIPLSTSAKARPPLTIPVSCLNKEVTAVCDQIRAVDKSRLKNQAGSLSEKDMNLLDDGLRQVLCL
jgi:mRNA interferase MazF